MKIVEALICHGPICVTQKVAKIDYPPFLAYLLPIENPEQIANALAFEEQIEARRQEQANA